MTEPTTPYVLTGLPPAQTAGEQMRGPGIIINGAFKDNALVSILDGEAVPVPSYVIGINGRGTLNLPEPEFYDLLSSMAQVYIDRLAPAAVDAPAA